VAVAEDRSEGRGQAGGDPAEKPHDPDRPRSPLLVREHDDGDAVRPAADDRERPRQLEPAQARVVDDTGEGAPGLPESIQSPPHGTSIPRPLRRKTAAGKI